MAAGLGPVYFTDENTLGLGKLLRRSGRDDVVYPGHEELAEVPLGSSVWIGAKQDLGPRDQFELFLKHEARLQREVIKRGAGPWAVAMSASGVRPLGLRGQR
jgi:hypothetical protein